MVQSFEQEVSMKKTALTLLFIFGLILPLNADQGGLAQLESDSLDVAFVGKWVVCNAMTVECDEINDVAYVGTGGTIHIIDIADPSSPQGITELENLGLIRDIEYVDQRIYAGDWDVGLKVISVLDPSEPYILGSY